MRAFFFKKFGLYALKEDFLRKDFIIKKENLKNKESKALEFYSKLLEIQKNSFLYAFNLEQFEEALESFEKLLFISFLTCMG